MQKDFGYTSIKNKKGYCCIAVADDMNFSKLIITSNSIASITMSSKTKLYFDGEEVGNCYNCVFSEDNEACFVFFSITNDIISGKNYYVSVPYFSARILKCRICGSSYSRGDILCECIQKDTLLLIDDITLLKVVLYDAKKVIENIDFKSDLFYQHFSGIVQSMDLTDE